MNDKDKEEFEKWFASLDDSHLSRVIKLNRGASQKTWKDASECKDKKYSNLMDAMTNTSQYNAKLQDENAKLIEQNQIISQEIKTYIQIAEKLQAENAKLKHRIELIRLR